MSHSCDFTKYKRDEQAGRENLDLFPLLVTAVSRASRIPDASVVGNVRAGRVARYFHLPGEAPLEEEHLVDFWWIQPVAVWELLATARLASMTDLWQRRLQLALARAFSWEDRKQPVPMDP